MRTLWTIAKREYNQYFNSPIAYVVMFMIMLVLGIIFAIVVRSSMQSALQSQMYGGSMSAPDNSPITGNIVFLLVFSIPALTMRLVSDEMRMGTMELLLTAPVRDWELVVGKWLGAFLFILTIVALTLVYPLILNGLVENGLDQSKLLASYIGVMLVAAALLGLGVGISSMFTNQIAAFFLTMGVFIFLWWLIGFPAGLVQGNSSIFEYLDMKAHFYDTFNTGRIMLADIIYYVSLTVLGLFVGTSAVEMRRWR
ncbi:MAG: ABC transporter permease subunit [Chloroflexi bacterium]|nr:ABC transporter permease subunit [Chloroflexota bacterium]